MVLAGFSFSSKREKRKIFLQTVTKCQPFNLAISNPTPLLASNIEVPLNITKLMMLKGKNTNEKLSVPYLAISRLT